MCVEHLVGGTASVVGSMGLFSAGSASFGGFWDLEDRGVCWVLSSVGCATFVRFWDLEDRRVGCDAALRLPDLPLLGMLKSRSEESMTYVKEKRNKLADRWRTV